MFEKDFLSPFEGWPVREKLSGYNHCYNRLKLWSIKPATMQVNGWTNWNRWHFSWAIGMTRAKLESLCLLFICLCKWSFLEKSFWQTGQGQLMSTHSKLSANWQNMYNISHLYRPQPPQFHCFPSITTTITINTITTNTTTTTTTTSSSSSSILLFSLLLLLLNSIVLNHRHRHHNSLKNCKPVS